MPVKHREFLEYLETVSCIRQFVIGNLSEYKVDVGDVVDSKIQIGTGTGTGIGILAGSEKCKMLRERKVRFVFSFISSVL